VFSHKNGERVHNTCKTVFRGTASKPGSRNPGLGGAKQGVPLLEVWDVPSHPNIEMTERYVYLTMDKLKFAVGALDRLRFSYAEREKGQGLRG